MKKEKLIFFSATLIGAFFIMVAAFYNGYPIFFSDSHIYMLSGFESYRPLDHPVTYGYFVKILSLNGVSLWPVVFFQSLMLSWLIFQVVKLVSGEKGLIIRGLIIILFLSLFTGLSWTASQIMPDIFAPIAFLSLLLILFGNLCIAESALLYFIFIISIAMHMSHVLLFTTILFFILLTKRWLAPQLKGNVFKLKFFILLLITVSAVIPMRYVLQNSKSIMFMGAMAEQGILQKYLQEYCPTSNYMLCKYKDSIPDNESKFLFSPTSPLIKLGGWTPEMQKESDDIVYATLTKPKYIALHVLASVKATCKQLSNFDIHDGNWSFTDSTGTIYSLILKYFRNESGQYIKSRQSQVTFVGMQFLIVLFRCVVALSAFLLVLFIAFYKKAFIRLYRTVCILFLVFVILNDWDLSTFSSVTDRYGCKVAWLIPFLAILAVFKLIQAKKSIVTLQ